MREVTVKLIQHGGYDGLKHLAFPKVVKGRVHDVLGYIDVPMDELIKIGYSKEAGQIGDVPDCAADSACLTFFQGSEAEVIA